MTLPPTAFTTYALLQPVETHRRPATCEEAGCLQWHRGWATSVLPGSTDEAMLIAGCRGEVDGRRRVLPTPETTPEGFHRYVFPPGTECFAASTHTVLHDGIEAIGIRRDGNKLGVGNTDVFRHQNLDEWVEDFGEHQQRLSDEAQKG